MANWYGTSRSNYFRVKDVNAFKKDVEALGLQVFNDEPSDLYAVAADELGDDGSWPSYHPDDENFENELDFISFLAGHLADGEVCVLLTAGAEKLCYITGHAQAFTNVPGQTPVYVSLSDIYAKAFEAFGIHPTFAEY